MLHRGYCPLRDVYIPWRSRNEAIGALKQPDQLPLEPPVFTGFLAAPADLVLVGLVMNFEDPPCVLLLVVAVLLFAAILGLM